MNHFQRGSKGNSILVYCTQTRLTLCCMGLLLSCAHNLSPRSKKKNAEKVMTSLRPFLSVTKARTKNDSSHPAVSTKKRYPNICLVWNLRRSHLFYIHFTFINLFYVSVAYCKPENREKVRSLSICQWPESC